MTDKITALRNIVSKLAVVDRRIERLTTSVTDSQVEKQDLLAELTRVSTGGDVPVAVVAEPTPIRGEDHGSTTAEPSANVKSDPAVGTQKKAVSK